MGIKNERLWEILEEKARKEDNPLGSDQKAQMQYIAGIEAVCEFAIKRAIMIRDSFPMYTLHDETHICNVMRLMTIAIQGISKGYQRQKTNLCNLMDGSAKRPRQYHAEAGVMT